ncbi:MAG TPA: histidine phosphatase family protein, partial [Pyrinomonadaceae bacterium]|nr:histidine phosphatase family protein [Pyrinomonadaceae bacterium]
MNKYFKFVVLLLLLIVVGQASAQKHKTIILIRHAEKDTSDSADQMNPTLSDAGKARSEKLVRRVGKYRPGAIYSTDFKRTRETIEPLAKKRGKVV